MSLVLDSLEIKNFRAFKHLRIEKLGRVNLIVGKNNVGKSSVLEALWIYAEQAEPALLYRILARRDEIALDESDERRIPVNAQERALALSNLFFNRTNTEQEHASIYIGSALDTNNNVQIDVRWPSATQNDVNVTALQPPVLILRYGQDSAFGMPLNQTYLWGERSVPIGYGERVIVFVVRAEGLSPNDLAVFWDAVALSDLENEVLRALRIIAPKVIAVNLVGSELRRNGRFVKARLHDHKNPVSLRSMGEGMNRMFGIALALVNAKDGMLLIDEVDTGLHYSVLPDLWKLIFEVAHRLNVQVFATSHSWDCIQAFQQAADARKDEEGVLIRLENRKDGVKAVTFDEEELAVVAREQIEVR